VTVWLPRAPEGGQGERQLPSPTPEGRVA
jgi:hypothetical protein